MIIALTGTPGTGKTSIASILNKKYEIETLHIHSFAKQENIIDDFDVKRKSDIIDIEILNDKIKKNVNQDSLIVLDGHLSHLLSCPSKVIVLRCNPIILETRLKTKEWNKEKIRENIEAEILDLIETEAVELHSIDNVVEIDTSNYSINEIAKIIHEMIKSNFSDKAKFSPGTIDWSEMLLKDEFNWMVG